MPAPRHLGNLAATSGTNQNWGGEDDAHYRTRKEASSLALALVLRSHAQDVWARSDARQNSNALAPASSGEASRWRPASAAGDWFRCATFSWEKSARPTGSVAH